MLYTIFWIILWLMSGGTTLSIGTGEFMALIVAILADLFFIGVWPRRTVLLNRP